jgi:hypothetical protein
MAGEIPRGQVMNSFLRILRKMHNQWISAHPCAFKLRVERVEIPSYLALKHMS